jgi:hypothetical protein
MSRFLRSSATRIGTGLAVILAGTGATVVIAGAGSAPAAAGSNFQHYLCYTATAPKGFTIPQGIRLVDNFSPNGFVPAIGKANLHCNPAVKIASDVTFPITNPTWHYLCFGLKTKQPSNTVTVANQFGSAKLVTKTPNDLCVPSWKSLTGPPNEPSNQPAGEDHYTCYPVGYAKGSGKFKAPASVQVSDEFSPTGAVKVKVQAPQELCAPTDKILPTGASFPPSNPSLNYLCFAVSKTPRITPVFDQNQFGTGTVTIKKTKWLCLPSTIGSSGTT